MRREKVREVVALYLNPPGRALVLCVDEKCRIQALDRTQPILPGMPERRTHYYSRHGTTTLFATPNIATVEVIGRGPSSASVLLLPAHDLCGNARET